MTLNRRTLLGTTAAVVASNLVHASEGHPGIEGRVFDPFGHHGTGDLLEFAGQNLALGNCFGCRAGRMGEQPVATAFDDVDFHLARMDRQGVETSVLSLTRPLAVALR